mmetsp:Transcript_22435/g.38008  ORF Transcript_22435/g.38008 Transcript_22435/m.38008 type:complete len:87 (-) Transcript_22435:156-416(-)
MMDGYILSIFHFPMAVARAPDAFYINPSHGVSSEAQYASSQKVAFPAGETSLRYQDLIPYIYTLAAAKTIPMLKQKMMITVVSNEQ